MGKFINFEIDDITDEEMLLLQDMESREPESGEINESDEEKCAPGGGRFDHLTEAELSTLEEEKYEKGTSYVTGWGVRILQGKYIKI